MIFTTNELLIVMLCACIYLIADRIKFELKEAKQNDNPT
jgi:hypothetical protein